MSLRPGEVRRLLVRGTNWVGDAVMSIPALRELRRLFPRARITLVVRPWVRDVYTGADFVDEILELDRQGRDRGWVGLVRFAGELRRRDFELAILLQNAFEAALLAWLARVPARLGYARDARRLLLTHPVRIDPALDGFHHLYYYLGILAGAGLLERRPWEDDRYRPSVALEVPDAIREAARRLLTPKGVAPDETVIGLNPGAAYGPAKRWLPERFAAVADRLSERHGARIAIFGAPAEAESARAVAERMQKPAVVLAGRTTLAELMGLLAECRLLVTNDSGPMHLAAALGVRQVAIFGSSSDAATGPWSPIARVVRQPVACSPCFLRRCPIDFRCMERVTVDDVLRAAEELI